jgi:glucokinase
MYVGLDVGGTFLKGARLDAAGNVAAQIQEPIRKRTTEELLAQLAAAVRALAGSDDAGSIVTGIGVGLPGIVDRASRVRVAPNVPVLDGLAVGDELKRLTGVGAEAANDANAAALAEAYRGAGRGADNVLFVSLGTGVGAGVILGGRIWSGASGYAGEIGHIQVVQDGVKCGCGSWGCLETVVGIPGWERRARAALDAGRPSSLASVELLDPKTIVEAAFDGEALALELLDEAARALSVGIAASLSLLNIERVVIGGGVANAGPILMDRVVEQTRLRTFPQVFADCTFRLAELGSDAGVIGAATLAMLQLESPRR